jgi:hypothetical protein
MEGFFLWNQAEVSSSGQRLCPTERERACLLSTPFSPLSSLRLQQLATYFDTFERLELSDGLRQSAPRRWNARLRPHR